MTKMMSILLAVAWLAGCSNRAPLTDPDFGAMPAGMSALETLRDVSVEARHELRLLAKAQESAAQSSMTAEQHRQRRFEAVHVPAGFEAKKTFHFQGKAVDAARALAILAGYGNGDEGFQVVNKPIANEPIVYISIDNRPLVEALHELGMQTGDQIRVEVYETDRLIRYVYMNQ